MQLDRERWTRLASEVGLPDAARDAAFRELSERYSESHRHYHNAQHICECLAEFDAVSRSCKNKTAVELAIWFHDAIYDPRAPDNEERSAALAASFLEGPLRQAVESLIMVTKHTASPTDPDAKLLVDIDLAILGKPGKRFWEYEQQIRAEYAWVPQEVFAAKRAVILESFLARPTIYSNAHFKNAYEVKARGNLTQAIEKLRVR